MARVIGPTGSRRRRRFLFLPVLLVGVLALLFVGGAQAVHDLNFQLDGDTVASPTGSVGGNTQNFDWSSFFNTAGAKSPVLPDATRPGFTADTFVKDFQTAVNRKGATVFDTSDSSTYTIGSKDILDISGWSCTPANNVTDKGDIMNAYAVAYTDPATQEQILYFALERNSNTGDANVAFWFLQGDASCTGSNSWTGNHSDGDILIVSAFTNGGSVSTIDAYRWTGGANGSLNPTPVAHGKDCRDPATGTGDNTCATSNTGTISTPWQTENKDDGVGNSLRTSEFFEGGLNLTNSGLGGKCFNTFVGDTRSSQSLTATLYDFARGSLGECKSTTVTTPTPGAGTTTTIPASGTLSTSDSALVTVDGVSSFNGTVSFHLCGPSDPAGTATCDTGGVAAGSASVTSTPSTKSSDTMTITSAGRYCWRADFSGDSVVGVPASSDHSSGECFIVGPRQSGLTTQAGAGPVDFGNPVTDTATLTNTANEPGTGGPAGSNGTINPVTAGGPALGTITFTLYKADCSTLATGTGTNPHTVNVSGDGTYGPVSFTPDAPGTYHWVASYTGDPPNTLGTDHNTTCNDTAEDVVVRTIPTEIKTKQSWYPNDTATITSSVAGNDLGANGTVVFSLYNTATCSGTVLYKETKTGVGGAHSVEVGTSNPGGGDAGTTSFNLTTDYGDAANAVKGPLSWKVVYTPAAGDTAHTGKQSACTAGSTEKFSTTYTNDAGPGTSLP